MHLVLTITMLGFAIWKGDWKLWQEYVSTIAYAIICNFLYNLVSNYYSRNTKFLPQKHYIVELFYVFINLPAVTLLYITDYPFSKEIG
jgi:hypothetical protein